MDEQVIVGYTEKVAAEIASEFAHAPRDELQVWVRLAHQREAMVTELYDLSQIDARLEGSPPSGAGAVIRSAIASIWAHEESHTHFLASVRSISQAAPALTEIQGKLEGKITRSAVSDSGGLARFCIAIGASLKKVPEFATGLRRMNLRELLRFYGELETTAHMGYQRMLDLMRTIHGAAPGPAEFADFGYTFRYDVARILSEEQFHQDVFQAMSRWILADGEHFVATSGDECVEVLHDLCERNLSVGAVQHVVDPTKPISKGPEQAGWVSHGGLGGLFADHSLSVPVVAPADIAAPFRT